MLGYSGILPSRATIQGLLDLDLAHNEVSLPWDVDIARKLQDARSADAVAKWAPTPSPQFGEHWKQYAWKLLLSIFREFLVYTPEREGLAKATWKSWETLLDCMCTVRRMTARRYWLNQGLLPWRT